MEPSLRTSKKIALFSVKGIVQGAAYVFERFLDEPGSEMAQDMSMKFFTTICYGV